MKLAIGIITEAAERPCGFGTEHSCRVAGRDAWCWPCSARETLSRSAAEPNDDEQEALDHLDAFMATMHAWGLQANRDELAAGVHTLQAFVVQHMLQRLNPDMWSPWFTAQDTSRPQPAAGGGRACIEAQDSRCTMGCFAPPAGRCRARLSRELRERALHEQLPGGLTELGRLLTAAAAELEAVGRAASSGPQERP